MIKFVTVDITSIIELHNNSAFKLHICQFTYMF